VAISGFMYHINNLFTALEAVSATRKASQLQVSITEPEDQSTGPKRRPAQQAKGEGWEAEA
jgi:hypothetical protein